MATDCDYRRETGGRRHSHCRIRRRIRRQRSCRRADSPDSRTGLPAGRWNAPATGHRDRRRGLRFQLLLDGVMMKTTAWGIDLGTTNSCIARATAAGVEVIHIDEAPTVPSVLAWDGKEF